MRQNIPLLPVLSTAVGLLHGTAHVPANQLPYLTVDRQSARRLRSTYSA